MTDNKEIETKLAEAQTQLQALAADNARMREGLLLRDAREIVRDKLSSASVPDVTKLRLQDALSSNPPVSESGALDREQLLARVSEAVSAELAYLAEAAGYGSGRVMGQGSTQAQQPQPEDHAERLREAFGAMGLTQAEAEIAARGRGW